MDESDIDVGDYVYISLPVYEMHESVLSQPEYILEGTVTEIAPHYVLFEKDGMVGKMHISGLTKVYEQSATNYIAITA
jgi:hypothetical protein